MKLGERFIKKGLVLAEQLKETLAMQDQSGNQLGEILLAITSMRSIDYYKTLAEHYGLDFVDLVENIPDMHLLQKKDQELYLSKLVIPIKKENYIYTIATANPSTETIDFIKSHWGDSTRIVCTAKFDILSTLQDKFHEDYVYRSVNQLIERNKGLSAKSVLSTWQAIIVTLILGVSIYAIAIKPFAFFVLLNVLLTISVSVILVYKIILSIIALFINFEEKQPDVEYLTDKVLPIYTILIPLYKEKEITLRHLFENLQKLSYPRQKLDIKILLEEDDNSTIEVIKKLNLPSFYEFIYVPPGEPRTKAKACNYGLHFAYGEYLTLYDAEDKPDPDQLKVALYAFLKHKGNNLACVQSRLNFYNKDENWLTRMFTIEYTYWFDLLLPALEHIRTPIPLGGTSNHFKTSVLKEIDAWDPYNVAEDADIGIRLERLGYVCRVIPSTTYEEANCHLINWIKQRTRWIKGYMQTYIVHMRNPFQLWRALGTYSFIGFQLFLGGTILSNLSYLVLWVVFIGSFFLTKEQSSQLFASGMLQLAYLNFAIGSIGIIFLNMLGILRRKMFSLSFTALTAPFYWLLISVASFRALYQLCFKPSVWEKTEHGISKMLK